MEELLRADTLRYGFEESLLEPTQVVETQVIGTVIVETQESPDNQLGLESPSPKVPTPIVTPKMTAVKAAPKPPPPEVPAAPTPEATQLADMQQKYESLLKSMAALQLQMASASATPNTSGSCPATPALQKLVFTSPVSKAAESGKPDWKPAAPGQPVVPGFVEPLQAQSLLMAQLLRQLPVKLPVLKFLWAPLCLLLKRN